MALKIQFNKTYLHELNKGLKIRLLALPILKAKEAALRIEVKRATNLARQIQKDIQDAQDLIKPFLKLWAEFPQYLGIQKAHLSVRKIAGIKTPVLDHIDFHETPHSYVLTQAWIPRGLDILKNLVKLHIERDVAVKKSKILERARKKTTQKVNLYEKVQIPEYQEGIRKIKRYLEDDEKLSKSSQKILKSRLQAEEDKAA